MRQLKEISDGFKIGLKPVAIFLLVVAGFFVFRRVPLVDSFLDNIQGRLAAVGSVVGRSVTRLLSSDDSLSALLDKCEENSSLLARDAVEFAKLKAENTELQTLLSYKESTIGGRAVTGKILARSLPENGAKIMLDKGAVDGIMAGSVAVVGQGMVLGVVSSVSERSALVTLSTSKESKLPAAVLGKKKTIGLLEGMDGAVLSMQFIPRDGGVSRGDVVVTSGLGGKAPEGLLLGIVTEVVDMPSAPFIESLYEPFEDPLNWAYVLILPPVSL